MNLLYPINPLICPICKSALSLIPEAKSYKCTNNHCFDIAKQGYVNLLPVHEKNSKAPGDSKEMVQARRDFLSRGFYKPISDALNSALIKHIESITGSQPLNTSPISILDLGSGEGYYTSQLTSFIQTHFEDKDSHGRSPDTIQVYGLDISKDAVKHASASNKKVVWMVGNNFHIPLANDSLDCLYSIFSPIQTQECARVLKPNGLFFRVLPGVNHLIEMRELIYDEVILNETVDYTQNIEGLEFESVTPIQYQLTLTHEDLLSLVKMTPHYWHTSKSNKMRLDAIETLNITIDMQLYTYSKHHSD